MPKLTRRHMLAATAAGAASSLIAPRETQAACVPAHQPIEGDWPALEIAHGPSLQMPTPDGITIVCHTTRPALVWVEYGTGDKLDRKAVPSAHGVVNPFALNHVIRLSDLQPGTRYRYRIHAKTFLEYELANGRRWAHRVRYGQEIATEPRSFTTLDPAAANYAFYIVQDIHEHVQRFDEMLNVVEWDRTAFIALNGDMINDFMRPDQNFTGFLDLCVKRFAMETPIVYARGNHDIRGHYAPTLSEYMALHDGRAYYAFDHGPVHYIVLDSGEDKNDGHEYYGGLADFDRYIDEQARWLKQHLASEAAQRAPFRVAIFHIPPYNSDWYGEVRVRRKWIPILNEGNVNLALCGHQHELILLNPGTRDNNFPILIGDMNTIQRVDVSPQALNITVIRHGGKVEKELSITCRS